MQEINTKTNKRILTDLPEINLIDYLAVLIQKRRLIIRITMIGVVIGVLLALFLPQKYTAMTTLMPPESNNNLPLTTMMADIPLSAFGFSGVRSGSDLMVEILTSRSVREGVIKSRHATRKDSLNLFQVFKTHSLEKSLRALLGVTTVSASEQGIISIKVTLGDPILAASVANCFVSELDRVNKEKNTSQAKSSRIYIESQLAQTRHNLAAVTAELAEFQGKNQAVDLEEQMRVAVENAGTLKGNILAQEIDLGVMQQTMKPSNPLIIRKQQQIEEMKKRYGELQFGSQSGSQSANELFIPFDQAPQVGLKLAELMREVKVQETVWELLNQQYYQARIQEARDIPTIQVLDRAEAPERRSSPKRKLLVLALSLLALVGSVFWTFGEQYYHQVRRENGNDARLKFMSQELGSDWRQIKGYFRKNGHSRN